MGVQIRVHLLDRVVPGGPSLHPEVLVQERAVEGLHEPGRLGPPHLRLPVLRLLELQEPLIGVPALEGA